MRARRLARSRRAIRRSTIAAPFGPNCTVKVGLSTAAAMASTRAICSAALGIGAPKLCYERFARRPAAARRAVARSGAVDEGVAVAHEHRERDAHADLARRPRRWPWPPRRGRSARGSACNAPSPSRRRRARRGRRRRARRDTGRPPASPPAAAATVPAACRRRRTRSATAAGNGRARWRARAWRGGGARRRGGRAISAISPSRSLMSTAPSASRPSLTTPRISLISPSV